MTPLLRLRGIGKQYGTLTANDSIDLEVGAGQIHAIVGENGAGKSTLMKIIGGVIRPDRGTIEWDGAPVSFDGPAGARRLGIGMVFQHFALFETLTVAENLSLALDAPAADPGLAGRIREVSERYGLSIDPGRLVHGLSVGERQQVEIVRCLLLRPRLLILDEPTSVLTPRAVATLFGTLRRIAGEGTAILFISHKLDEIRELCDVATVLRAGRVTASAVPAAQSGAQLARLMVGDEATACVRTESRPQEVRLELRGVSVTPQDPLATGLAGVSLAVRSGEIVGIAGVSGNGQQELLAVISGERVLRERDAILLDGRDVGALDAGRRRLLGLGYVPEQRLGKGTVPSMDLIENCLLTGERAGLVQRGLLRRRAALRFATDVIGRFDVRGRGVSTPAQSLSGGNLQKFIIGREILLEPRMLVVAQPTWGIDAVAARKVHEALVGLRGRGCAVLVVSEDLDELFTVCDRIAVMFRGTLSAARPTASLTVDAVGLMMGGGDAAA